MKARDYNFGAGPAMLPSIVLERMRAEIFDWRSTGVSVMEIGHRTPQFQGLIRDLLAKLRSLLHIPANYQLVLTTGGAQGQFDAIPLNLTGVNQHVDYFISGTWSKKAALCAQKYAQVNIVTTAATDSIPDASTWQLNPNAAYAYYCPNETVAGLSFPEIPRVGNVPLVADLTSLIASGPLDYSQFGLAFASAQKNLGIAGVTLVIIREDLLEQAASFTPLVWNYKLMAAEQSSINTPPTFAIYMMDLMVDWMIAQGGVLALEAINQRKMRKLYHYIDNSEFYFNSVLPQFRSALNIPFNLLNNDKLPQFLNEANACGLRYLKGHISVGGARASLYNSMPESGVDKLIEFMQDFAVNHLAQ
jgi:phosphoserine aminotransferase